MAFQRGAATFRTNSPHQLGYVTYNNKPKATNNGPPTLAATASAPAVLVIEWEVVLCLVEVEECFFDEWEVVVVVTEVA